MPESLGRFIVKIGVTSAIALLLVYRLSGHWDTQLSAAQTDAAATRLAVEAHVRAMEPLAATLDKLVNLALQQCVNTADDVLKQDRCFRALTIAPAASTALVR